jgi:hypothetical protein
MSARVFLVQPLRIDPVKAVVSLRRDEALQQAHRVLSSGARIKKLIHTKCGAARFCQHHVQEARLISAKRDGYIDSGKINVV